MIFLRESEKWPYINHFSFHNKLKNELQKADLTWNQSRVKMLPHPVD